MIRAQVASKRYVRGGPSCVLFGACRRAWEDRHPNSCMFCAPMTVIQT